MEVSGEAADLVMKEGVQISEEAIKLLARGAKNLAALLYALAKDQKKLYGKVNMNRLQYGMLQVTSGRLPHVIHVGQRVALYKR